jgi:hypothetical protein
MIKAHEIFSCMIERDSDVHVKLGDDTKYVVKGEGIITFYFDSRGVLDAHDMIYITCLKKIFLSV